MPEVAVGAYVEFANGSERVLINKESRLAIRHSTDWIGWI